MTKDHYEYEADVCGTPTCHSGANAVETHPSPDLSQRGVREGITEGTAEEVVTVVEVGEGAKYGFGKK